MLRSYKYPLLVWLTTAVLGSVTSMASIFLYDSYDASSYSYYVGSVSAYVVFFVAYSIIVSIPAFVILWLAYWQISRQDYSSFKIRVVMVVVSQCIFCLLMYLLFRKSLNAILQSGLFMVIPYSLSLLLSSIVYKVKLIDKEIGL
jgi:hypothetical protein